jgi:hypothetical protein
MRRCVNCTSALRDCSARNLYKIYLILVEPEPEGYIIDEALLKAIREATDEHLREEYENDPEGL